MPTFLMPAFLFRRKPLLFALLGALAAAAVPSAAQSQSTPLTPAAKTKLRRLLPFPSATLSPKMEVSNFGIGYSLGQGFRLARQTTDYAGQIVAVRRQMTGGTADAARYRTLGGLYRRAGLPAKSAAAFRQSEALYSAVLARRPHDGAALAGYGQTLRASGQIHDAAAYEAYLRKAALSAPNSADVWMALGSVLASEATPKTEPEKHWEREAGAAYNKAVSLAPQNPAVWAVRGDFRSMSLPQFQGKFFSRDGLSDYQRSADLSPRDPYAQAMVPTIDYSYVEIHYNLYTSPAAAAKETPAAIRRAKTALRRITAVAQSTTGAQSASAYAARAWVQFQFCYDPKGAQKSERLALQQNPRQQDAIDYQMHVAAVTGDDALLAAACRRELRHRSQIYLRIVLAYADYCISQQKPLFVRDALEQMALAHAAAPHDDALRLGLAVLLLKSGQRSDLSRAAVLLRETAPSSPLRTKSQQAEYDLTRGIGAALTGDTSNACRFLDAALQDDPHNRAVKSALALLPATAAPQAVTNP